MAVNDEGFIERFLELTQEDFDLIRDNVTFPPALNWQPRELSESVPVPCKQCSSHPSNGGSGICHCTLALTTTY